MSNFTKLMAQAAAGNVAGGDFYDYTIDNSLFVGDGTKYLYHTGALASTPTDRKKLTISFWFKQCNFQSNTSAQNYFYLGMSTGYPTVGIYGYNTSADQLEIVNYRPSPEPRYLMHTDTDMAFRDVSAWYHLVLVVDTTLSTATDRYIIYVNGSEITHTWRNQSSNTPQNAEFHYFNLAKYAIGAYVNPNTAAYDPRGNGYYLAEYHAVDGTAYAPTDFGEFKNGVWIPKETSGISYGNGGFYLDFADSSDLGKDVSGNANHFSTSSMSSSDQKIDTPTNNFATYNGIWQSSGLSHSEGNLKQETPTVSQSYPIGVSTIPMTSGSWYFETYINLSSVSGAVGIIVIPAGHGRSYNDRVTYSNSGNKNVNGTSSSYGASWTTGDIIGCHYDADGGTVTFYKNGTSQGVAATSVPNLDWLACTQGYTTGNGRYDINFGQNGTFNGNVTAGGNSDANGIGDFKYTVPTGALALCTANLPEPTIGPNSATTSDENFDTILFNKSTAPASITGLEFQPDIVWTKNIANAYHSILFDAVRGASSGGIYPSGSEYEDYFAVNSDLVSFDTNGFTIGSTSSTNVQLGSNVGWTWKVNGSGSSNSDGSITSTVSANTDSGVSIVTYAGTSANATIGHGLGVAPKMVICKNRDVTTSWPVYHSGLSSAAYAMYFDITNAQGSFPTLWNSTAPTSSVFNVGTGGNQSNGGGYNYVAYCFAEVEGFSSFGSYTGNGSTDGPFIYTGFRPAFVIIRETGNTNNWMLFDDKRLGYNVDNKYMLIETPASEGPGGFIDILSNGFKCRNTQVTTNRSSGNYIYMAFAENPFKYANAR